MKKLENVLLIDDDDATNYIHKYVFKKVGCTDNLHIEFSAQNALTRLNKKDFTGQRSPELIFLDLNIPVMNGWEFLEEFKKIKHHTHSKIIILTTSLNPDDRKRAAQINEVVDFKNKPLTIEEVENILSTHFAEYA